MNLNEAKKAIPVYIGTHEMANLLNVGTNKAKAIFRQLKEEHKDVPTPYEKKIPLDWVVEKYGKKAK